MNHEQNQNQQKKKMSTEELERTHVLNLDSFKEVIQMEKRTSKKPAFFIATLGIIAILVGISYQVAGRIALEKEEERLIEQRRLEKKKSIQAPVVMTEYINCSYYVPNNPNGTDYLMEINYGFINEQLMEFTKKFTLVATPSAPNGPDTVNAYLNDYQAFLNPIDGYQISVTPTTNTGLVTLVNVDFDKLNLQLLSPKQSEHFSTSVDYMKYEKESTIRQDMISKGYTCE